VAWAKSQSDSIRFVYISTDQIYDAHGPSTEENARPQNVYALTKMWAEDVVGALPDATILRVNFLGVGHANRQSLADWIVNSLRAETPITLFRDAMFNPLYAGDLAEIVVAALAAELAGVFNCGSGDDGLSKAELGLHLADALGFRKPAVTVGSIADIALAARRPRDTRMECTRLATALNTKLPSTGETLTRLVDEMRVVAGSGVPMSLRMQ
jgi:dTDP-4-dehydrorhamnose reductase